MYNRFSAHVNKQSFISNFVLLMAIVIVLTFAYGFLPTGMTAARSIVDVIQFIVIAMTMAYVLKTIIEDF